MIQTLPDQSTPTSVSTSEVHTTLHNVGWLIFQRFLMVLIGVFSAITVPRLMGPDTFGRFTLLLSLAVWFTLFSGMGSTQLMGRFVQDFKRQNDQDGLRKLVSSLLAMRLTNGLGAACLYFLVTSIWLREIDPWVLLFVAISVSLRSGTNLIFAFFLGLNQAARWGVGEVLRRWLSLTLLLIGFFVAGLRGACFALLITEAILLIIGWWWARDYFSWKQLRIDRLFLTPYLRFGLSFFFSNFLLIGSHRGGEMLLRFVTDDYHQIAYFGLAYNVYQIGSQAIWQICTAFLPFMTHVYLNGDEDTFSLWAERLMKWIAILGVYVLFTVMITGNDIVPLVFGSDYRPVSSILIPLMATIILLALTNIGRLATLVHRCPGEALIGASFMTVGFWVIGYFLVRVGGGLGVSYTILLANGIYAVYLTTRLKKKAGYRLRDWWLTVILSSPFWVLIWFRGGLLRNMALLGLFLIGYSALLWVFHIVNRKEFIELWHTYTRRDTVIASADAECIE